MKNYKQLAVSLSILTLLISGCASTSKNIQIIEKKKQNTLKTKIKISDATGYKAYFDSDNNLKYICASNSDARCNYYSNNKHSYRNGTPDEEFIMFNKNGYYPPLSPNTKGVQCGTGSLAGWLTVFSGIKNYSTKNPTECYSKFTKVDSTQITERVGIGLLTFMTPLMTGGTMHTNKFDKETFIDSIYISNIETFRQQLLETISMYKIDGGIDVIYLEESNIDNNLENKYKLLLMDKSLKAGVIFIEKDTNRLLAINVFNKYKDKNILQSISLQIEDILNNMSKNNTYLLKYEDIKPYIPAKINLPSIPHVDKIIKDEFETKDEFNNRVISLVKKRENKIKSLQRKYSLDVFERNTYITNLQQSYTDYLEYKANKKNKLLNEIKEKVPLLSKILFLENISGYNANKFIYDAEEEKLYFTIYSNQKKFKQEVVSIIPRDKAKKIKLNHSFKIIPQIISDKNKLILKGFEILEIESNNLYKVNYTNKNFKPESITLRVTGMKESIKKEISTYFQKFKQKNIPIIDTKQKEIWYIDIVNNINAKVPKWFASPVSQDKIIGYGEGKTLREAKLNARTELALMINVQIHSEFKMTSEISDFKKFSEVKESLKQATNVTLNPDEYTLYKQEKSDGIWYVGFKYLNK